MGRSLTALAIGLALVAIGCGSGDSSDESTSAADSTTPADAPDPLVGKWTTENVCEDELQAFEQAGLQDYVDEWVAGAEYPGQKPAPGNPCRGAKPVKHSHSFGADGAFASYNEFGAQVDDDTYVRVDDQTLTLGKPPVTVRYEIEADRATFDVVVPNCESKRCEESAAYVVSVFFPRTYKRAG